MKITRILSIIPAHLAACCALIIPFSAARAQSLTVTTVAGSIGSIGGGDGTGAAAHFNAPFAIAVDGAGILYVADSDNSMIRKISTAGVVQTIAGLGGLNRRHGRNRNRRTFQLSGGYRGSRRGWKHLCGQRYL